MKIYDFLYVDTPKVISVYSQLTGGLVDVHERTTSSAAEAENKRQYDFRVFRHDAGGATTESQTHKSTVKPHHALLVELEEELLRSGQLLDLTSADRDSKLADPETRATLKNTFCIKAKGRAVFEDYERIKKIGQSFPTVCGFINKSIQSGVREKPEYLELSEQLSVLEQGAKEVKDRNQRAFKQQEVKTLRKQVERMVETAGIAPVDEWILDGMAVWIDTYLPGIFNVRIYPNTDDPAEHIFGNLKHEFVEASDLNSFHFTYGSLPTEALTILGIVTSVPDPAGEQFKPLAEFEREDLEDFESVENGFRALFRGFDGLESMIRTCHFPRVMVYPLLVYRDVVANPSAKLSR